MKSSYQPKKIKKFLVNQIVNIVNPVSIFILFTSALQQLQVAGFLTKEDMYVYVGDASSLPILLGLAAAWVIWKMILGTGIEEGNKKKNMLLTFVLLYTLASIQTMALGTALLKSFAPADNLRVALTFALASLLFLVLGKIMEFIVKRSEKIGNLTIKILKSIYDSIRRKA